MPATKRCIGLSMVRDMLIRGAVIAVSIVSGGIAAGVAIVASRLKP